MKTLARLAALSIALSAAQAAEPPASGQALTFSWPASLACNVTQVVTLANSGEEVTSHYTMKVTPDGSSLRVAFGGFAIQNVKAGERGLKGPKLAALHDTLERPQVEREFFIDPSGRFVGAEPVAAADKRLSSMKSGGGAFLPLTGVKTQAKLDSEYAAGWGRFIGDWIGLQFVPDVAQDVMIPHEAAGYWEDSNVPTIVTVSAASDCTRGAKATHCVTIRSHYLPGLKSTTLDTRAIQDAELVMEPETLIPHSWIEEKRQRGESLTNDPNGALQMRTARTFDCGS
jgi:hypothetical protein